MSTKQPHYCLQPYFTHVLWVQIFWILNHAVFPLLLKTGDGNLIILYKSSFPYGESNAAIQSGEGEAVWLA
jgi:hypothetical protein